MTRRITRHENDPAPDQGSITVWSEREFAVSAFRLSAPAGAVELLDLDQRVALPAHSPVAVEDYLGPVVFPDVAAYRRGSGWHLAQVLEQLGVDAGELAEVELEDEEFGACLNAFGFPHDGAEGLAALRSAAWVEGEPPVPYNFAEMPPDSLWPHDVDQDAVIARVAEVVDNFRGHAEIEGRLLSLSDDMRATIRSLTQAALEERWPGVAVVEVTTDREQRRFITKISPKVTPQSHAAAWARFMAEHDPRGYEILETSQGWKWRLFDRRARPEVEAVAAGNTAIDIAANLQAELVKLGHTGVVVTPTKPDRAAARASAWTHYLEIDAETVADLLAIAGVWPEVYDPETRSYKAPGGFEVELDRRVWILSWSLLDRGLAATWAACTHVAASDNDDVKIPPRPACLDRERPA